VLQLIGRNGSTIGQLGEPAGSRRTLVRYLHWRRVLHSAGNGPSTWLRRVPCRQFGRSTLGGDSGHLLGLNGTAASTDHADSRGGHISGAGPGRRTTRHKLANNSGSVFDNLALQWRQSGASIMPPAISTVTEFPHQTLAPTVRRDFSLNAEHPGALRSGLLLRRFARAPFPHRGRTVDTGASLICPFPLGAT